MLDLTTTPVLPLWVDDEDEDGNLIATYSCTITRYPSIEAYEDMQSLIREGKYIMAGQIWVNTGWVEGDQEILERPHLMMFIAGKAMDKYKFLNSGTGTKKN